MQFYTRRPERGNIHTRERQSCSWRWSLLLNSAGGTEWGSIVFGVRRVASDGRAPVRPRAVGRVAQIQRSTLRGPGGARRAFRTQGPD